MSMDSPQQNKAWRYVHGEMSEQEREALERDLMSDPALARDVEATREVDHLLRLQKTVPLLDDSSIVRLIEKEWDQDQAGSKEAPPLYDLRDIVAPPRSFWSWLSPVAVAALLLLCVVPAARLMHGRPLAWDSPALVQDQLRGGTPLATRQEQVDGFVRDLQKIAGAAYREQHAWSPAYFSPMPWRIETTVSESPVTGVSIRIRALPAQGEGEPVTWTADYVDWPAAAAQVEEIGREVAGRLYAAAHVQ